MWPFSKAEPLDLPGHIEHMASMAADRTRVQVQPLLAGLTAAERRLEALERKVEILQSEKHERELELLDLSTKWAAMVKRLQVRATREMNGHDADLTKPSGNLSAILESRRGLR